MAQGLKRPKALRSEELPFRLCIRSEVFLVVNIHIVIWAMTPCGRMGGYSCLEK
jgi:hypothetical protein